MNTLNMPGFTAEASLCKVNKRYPVVETGTASPTQVVPQFATLCDKARYFCEIGYNSKWWCAIEERCDAQNM